MTLRKTAGLMAVAGLLLGLVGSGVGASFVDSVTGTENISVGTFQCIITDSTQGTVSGDNKSVTYNAPEITSSAPGSAPFDFTVKNIGSIPMALSVSVTGPTGSLDGDFSDIPATLSQVILNTDDTAVVSTGIQWDELEANDLGDSGSMIWTVSCADFEVQQIQSADFNLSGTGWAGWSCPAGTYVVSASFVGPEPATVGLAKPGETTDGSTYPTYPHYTYTPPEQGAVVHNGGTSQTGYLLVNCTQP